MKRVLMALLFALGGFLLIAGLIAAVWAPGVVKRTPLNVDSTTRLSGQVGKLDTATGKLVDNPVKVESITKSDNNASDKDVIAFTNSTCVVLDINDAPNCVDGKDPRLVTASTDVFASDRKTALAVNSSKYLPKSATPHSGVMNKWPFGAEKKTYPYWDGVTGEAVPARFARVQKLDGFETYVYKVDIKDAKIEIAEGVPGTYDDAKEIFIDPATGAIISQKESQQRTLTSGSTKALDLNIAFTDKQVATNIADAKTNIKSLNLITKTVPLVGIIGGILLLGLAMVLWLRGRHRSRAHV